MKQSNLWGTGVTSSSWFAGDVLDFSTGSPHSWKSPHSLANQDDLSPTESSGVLPQLLRMLGWLWLAGKDV